jgi:Na+-transporting methylmalonyl-CoA/oxaloacetate decarboxylase gamma subunit
MQIRKLTIGFLIVLMVTLCASKINAQSVNDLRFTEYLVHNDSLNVDGFGKNSSWIEIFNSGYNAVEIGGCYLTDDLSNPTKYWIPTGDPKTLIPSRNYVIFWADGKPTRGIDHLNFELKGAKVIALFQQNGKTVVDKFEIVEPQYSNKSYGLFPDVNGQWQYLDKITPASDNDHSPKVSSGEKFVEMDPTGVGMAIIAMSVVFAALALLYIIYKSIGRFFTRQPKVVKRQGEAVSVNSKSGEMSGELNAAIATTLYLYASELHDDENTVLTIKKVSRNYSPWSSKIYTLRKYPR